MEMKTYLTESARTASDQYHTTNIERPWEAAGLLQKVVDATKGLDQIKKSLFYGKEFDERQLDLFFDQGGMHEHLTARFDRLPADPVHAIIGIITEAGELAELLIEAMNTGQFNEVYLREEIGDQLWYIAMLLRWSGTDFEETAAGNIAKLRTRFPDKFDAERAKMENRDYEKERAAMMSK